jgi:hypothetical protein
MCLLTALPRAIALWRLSGEPPAEQSVTHAPSKCAGDGGPVHGWDQKLLVNAFAMCGLCVQVTVDLFIIRSMGVVTREYLPSIQARLDIVGLLDEWAARWGVCLCAGLRFFCCMCVCVRIRVPVCVHTCVCAHEHLYVWGWPMVCFQASSNMCAICKWQKVPVYLCLCLCVFQNRRMAVYF